MKFKNAIYPIICALLYAQFSVLDAQTKSKTEPEFLPSPPIAGLPFSEAVRVGETLYLSGQLGIDPQTKQLVAGGMAAETKQCFENTKAILEKYGSSLDRVVKVTVMLTDMKEWEAMNKVYVTYFQNHLPARSAFAVATLAKGARIEIECIAVAK